MVDTVEVTEIALPAVIEPIDSPRLYRAGWRPVAMFPTRLTAVRLGGKLARIEVRGKTEDLGDTVLRTFERGAPLPGWLARAVVAGLKTQQEDRP